MQETPIYSLSWTVGDAGIENLILPHVAGFSLLYILNIETGDPPAGWGVRRTISNKEFRTAEVIERNKTMFFTSIFCGSLFCGSAVHILDD
jgi:hypothetical protein